MGAPEESEHVWTLQPPSAWPAPPETFSFSSLVEIEACPRRWALRWASYPNLPEVGYPESTNLSAVLGSVVHRAVEVTTRVLEEAKSGAQGEGWAVEALRKAGGLSTIVRQSIDHCLGAYTDNPRAQGSLADARRTLEGRVGDIRARVQSFVARLEVQPGPPAPESGSTGRRGETGRDYRSAVLSGTNAEVYLKWEALGFRGVADLIVLSPDRCEIRDFKTGPPKEAHVLQIRIYSLLWLADAERNPTGRPADQLTLSYASHDVSVPVPGPAERGELEEDLRRRLDLARERLVALPPAANPSNDVCSHCPVRQLCDPFWSWLGDQDAPSDEGWFGDIAVQLAKPRGPTSWDAMVVASTWGEPGTPALVRLQDANPGLTSGQSLRLLNVYVVPPSEDEVEVPMVVTLTGSSEMFFSKKAPDQ